MVSPIPWSKTESGDPALDTIGQWNARCSSTEIVSTATDEETMSDAIRYDRRRFLGTAVMATAGAGLVGSIPAATKLRTNGSPGPIKQVDAGNLDVGYTEAGPSNGPPAILLRGSPESINGNDNVAQLAASGYRVIVPYVRNSGTKRLVSSDAMRNGQQTTVVSDVMALMDALKIERKRRDNVDETIADMLASSGCGGNFSESRDTAYCTKISAILSCQRGVQYA
jgi:hypothetical protein